MALFVFNLLGAALLGIGLFVTVPISVLMMARGQRGKADPDSCVARMRFVGSK